MTTLPTSTFVGDGHFERYANDSHKVFSGHQRAQDGTNTQSFTFPLVDELKKRESEVKTFGSFTREKSKTFLSYIHASPGHSVPEGL